MAITRKPRIDVRELTGDEITADQRSAYGALYVAKVGDFESAPRSTEAKAIAECEAHLAAVAAAAEAA